MGWIFDDNKPIYIQIAEKLKFDIISGKLQIGAKISSVRELAEEAGVNPNTMQRALTELERQNLVFSQRTNGRFVTDDRERISDIRSQYAIEKIKQLTETLFQMGYTRKELLELIEETLKGEI